MKETVAHIQESLESLYPPGEIRSFIRIILSHICGLSHNQQILCKDRQLPEKEKEQIYTVVSRLKNMEPLQYIIGETEFYSMSFGVNSSVLIPRPETEELVDMIVKSHTGVSPVRILDIGTGSGCIAIALAKNIPNSEVTAVDVSAAALQTAKDNAARNDVDVHFIQADILTETVLIHGEYDIIVSNPPYIKEAESESMDANVLDYEPHIALFVPNEDPLLFYRAIADFAVEKLKPGGMIYFEINAMCDVLTGEMLHEKGFLQTEIHCDLSGKNRFISVRNSC